MKVAIATDDGMVSAHFGRCSTYTIVDIEDGCEVGREEIENPEHSPGYLPGYLAEKGVNCIVAGGMGPRAQHNFARQNIRTIIGVGCSVDEAVEGLLAGTLEEGDSTCERDADDMGEDDHHHHHGRGGGGRGGKGGGGRGRLH